MRVGGGRIGKATGDFGLLSLYKERQFVTVICKTVNKPIAHIHSHFLPLRQLKAFLLLAKVTDEGHSS